MTNKKIAQLLKAGSWKKSSNSKKCRDKFLLILISIALMFAVWGGTYDIRGKLSSKKNVVAAELVGLTGYRNNVLLSVNNPLAERINAFLRFSFSQFVRNLLKQQNGRSYKPGIHWNENLSTQCMLQREGLPEKFVQGTCFYGKYSIAFQISAILKNITPVRAGPAS